VLEGRHGESRCRPQENRDDNVSCMLRFYCEDLPSGVHYLVLGFSA
jgi:hypothetical protein